MRPYVVVAQEDLLIAHVGDAKLVIPREVKLADLSAIRVLRGVREVVRGVP